MRDYLTLHLDTNESKGTACSKKGHGCKWTWETFQHYIYILSYYKLFLYFNLCLSVMLGSLSFSFTSISFLTTSCSFTYMDVNENERLSNITLRHKLE
jgi:hypothetical protein